MNILLTGGAGYIGSHTAVVLANNGHRVVLFDNLSNSTADLVDRINQIIRQRLPLIVGDVRDSQLLRVALREHKIDAVIHFAGLKAVGESIEKPIDYYANNIQGTISLLQSMKAESVKRIIFSSSATVYGEPQYLPIDESHPTRATNPYGRSKLHNEEILADVVRSDSTWKVICLRYFNPVGAHESGLIGEAPCGIPNNLMPYISQVAAGQQAELTIFGNNYLTPDGTCVRDYVHVCDLAEGHDAAINYLDHSDGILTVNLGTGLGYSVLEMVKAFVVASGRPVPYNIGSRRIGDSSKCWADPSLAQRVLGWKASRDLNKMCADTWRWQLRSAHFSK